MSLGKKFRHWKLNKSRTEAFSDGVFAIVITLLILEIKIPHIENGESSRELWEAMKELAPKIISWVVSFFFVAVMWVQHHNLFRIADKIDYAVVWLNIILLFFICFIPFPVALMGEYPHNRLAVLFFGIVVTCAAYTQVGMYAHMSKYYLLPKYDYKSVRKNVRRSFFLAPMLLNIAIAVSFVNLMLCYVIYAMVPLFFLLPFDKEENTD
ncbi:MAG TPA: DUF1211 domain-containing protein [Bacteroidetes bacterium]|nr:DUF1211 domain-containing protein [Bacteroidota bacterium]